MTAALFFVLLGLLLLNVPIAVCLTLACGTAMVVGGLGGNLVVLPQKMFTAMDSFPFMAVPFFMLAGGFQAGRRHHGKRRHLKAHYFLCEGADRLGPGSAQRNYRAGLRLLWSHLWLQRGHGFRHRRNDDPLHAGRWL